MLAEGSEKSAPPGAKGLRAGSRIPAHSRDDNPLDGTAVHPESYPIVEKMARDLGVSVQELMQNDKLLKKIDLKKYMSEKVGASTLADILEELSRPGRDPRQEFEAFSFAPGVEKIEDLQAGMKLPGIVTNVTAFGAFVDVGVHQDGLVHISQLRDGFVKNPSRCGEGQAKGHGQGAGCGSGEKEDIAVDERMNGASFFPQATPNRSHSS